jgi:uncharacterized protein involved in exopolysaccharide biosynthesis
LNRATNPGIVGLQAISEAARHDLYNALTQAIGPGPTETSMSAVPLHDLEQVATKGDLAVTAADLRVEMADLTSEMANLKTGMAAIRAQLKTDIAELRAELKSDIAALRRSMTNWMLTLLVAVVGAMASIGFATTGG